jgi:uncharacterized protein YdeI (YjbR/CyaY-like superfamily)
MPSNPVKTFDARTVAQWRAWLEGHHGAEPEVWLVFRKGEAGRKRLGYEEAVREALCFGWIDSLVKRLDDERYARKFTPRKPGSRWSETNRKRYADLEAEGRLMPAGLARAPTGRRADVPRWASGRVPRYIQEAISSRPAARGFFRRLAPSYRRIYVGWIDSARKPETRMRRLREAVGLLAAGKKLGLK